MRDEGAEVRVVLTSAASEFVTPLVLQAVSGNEVRQDLFDQKAEAGMGHIELARWADAIVIAPASADYIAKLSKGCLLYTSPSPRDQRGSRMPS